jgi:hypothetical protein
MHVSDFPRARLRAARGASLGSKELRPPMKRGAPPGGHGPFSQPKFAMVLKALGHAKWKSCGFMRYRDLEFAA